MEGKKIRKTVLLDEELIFLKRLQGAGELVNMVLKQIFDGCKTEGERMVRAMKILDGRIRLKITLGSEGELQGIREERQEFGKVKERKSEKRQILSELAKAAKEFEA